jgi:hypothetical protein
MASERQIQVGFTSFMNGHYKDVIYYHVPNETAKHKVPEGVKAGIPDCIIDEARGIYNGLRIELKKHNGTLTEAQKRMRVRFIEKGYHWETCYSLEEAKNAVNDYMSL